MGGAQAAMLWKRMVGECDQELPAGQGEAAAHWWSGLANLGGGSINADDSSSDDGDRAKDPWLAGN